MPGFIALSESRRTQKDSKSIFEQLDVPKRNMVNDFIQAQGLYVERLTINKFMNDKVFFSDSEYFILIEGVVLNSLTLVLRYNKTSFKDCIIEMYRTSGEMFFNEFRGSFCGIFYDIKADKKIIFTDHIGSKQVFYSSIGGGGLLLASDMLYIAEYFKHNNIPTTLNISGAYSLLTISSMIEDATLFSEVKRLLPGHYLLISCNKYEVKRYYKLKFEYNCNLPEKEIIDKLDRLFADAVKLGLEKDREYGYKHSVALSAGLDSRMTTFVANKLGYGHSILNNTFSQTDYLDETIPKKIASELRHKWLFKSLDNGLFLLDIDKTIKVTSGMVSCNGSAHALDYFETFNFDNYGLQHSGQLGDVIVGSYIRKFSQLSQDYSFSSILKSKLIDTKGIPPVDLQLSYDNAEDFLFFHRGYMCVNQGLVALQYFTETVSPFLDIEFLEYCMSIHPEIRMHHKLYYKWINAKHPAVAKYTHEMLGAKINARKITLFGFTVPIKRLPIAAIQFFLIKLNIIKNNAGNSKKSMNPFGYWYNTNEDFRAAIHSYYNSYSGKLHQYPDLAKDCEAVFLNGTVAEKFRVLTLIGMLKMYF